MYIYIQTWNVTRVLSYICLCVWEASMRWYTPVTCDYSGTWSQGTQAVFRRHKEASVCSHTSGIVTFHSTHSVAVHLLCHRQQASHICPAFSTSADFTRNNKIKIWKGKTYQKDMRQYNIIVWTAGNVLRHPTEICF